MSQTKLASELGMRQTALANYENGNRRISVEHLAAVARYYGVSIDSIVNGDTAPHELLRGERYTDEELRELANYAKYIIYKRREN